MPEADLTSDDYYKVLGVSKDVTDRDLKKAYRKLAMKWHPDRDKDSKDLAEKNFKIVGEAFGVLSDKDKRKTYDQFGKKGLENGGFNHGNVHDIFKMFFGGGDPFGGGMGGMGGMHFDMGGMGGDPFGMGGFGRRSRGHGHRHQKPPEKDLPSPIPKGSRVTVHSLSNGSYNGSQGTIQKFNGERFTIKLMSDKSIKVKRQNICPETKLTTQHLSNNTNNGVVVLSRGYSNAGDRMHVQFPNGQISAVKPENLQYSKGSCIYLYGLSHEVLNGKNCNILEWVEEKSRYKVQLFGKEKTYHVKPENVKL
eukprot:UN30159